MTPSRSACLPDSLSPRLTPERIYYQKYIPGLLTEQEPEVYTKSRYFTGDIETGTMDTREQRGLLIAATCRITKKHDQWIVPSQTGNGSYRVNLNPPPFVPQCTCPD